MNNIKVDTFALDPQQWDEELSGYHHSIFLTSKWLSAISNKHTSPVYLNIYSKNQVIGKISGIIIPQNILFGKKLLCYAGPALLSLNQEIYNLCFIALHKYAIQNSFSRIVIQSYDNNHSLKCENEFFFINHRVEFVAYLNQNVKEFNIKKRFIRNVKKANHYNIDNQSSNSSKYVHKLVSLLKETLEKRITKYHINYDPFYLTFLNEKSLAKLAQNGLGIFHFTLTDNKIHSMEFNLEFNKQVYMLLKGTDKDGYSKGFSSWLSYQMLINYTNKGYKTYNLGGRSHGSDGEGLAIYKKSMGSKEIDVYGATTNFLIFPYSLINPILNLGRKLPREIWLVKLLKRII